MDPKSVPNAQSVPNVVQSVKRVQSQEQELDEILRELNLSLPPKVRNALDVNFILEGVHVFLGELGVLDHVSTEVKNT